MTGKHKAAWAAKAEWMAEWAKICSNPECGRTASPVAGVVPFDTQGLCWYCRNKIAPPEKPTRRTVRP